MQHQRALTAPSLRLYSSPTRKAQGATDTGDGEVEAARSLTQAVLESGAFAGLEPEALGPLSSEFSLITLAAGETLISAGGQPTEVFVVLSGRVAAFLPAEKARAGPIATLERGALVGEMSVLAGGPRATTVRAVTDAEVARLDAAAFMRLLESYQGLAVGVSTEATRRLRANQLAQAITEHLHLSDPSTLAWVEQNVGWTHLRAGELLFRQDDLAKSAYFVLSGRLRVIRNDGHGDIFRGEIGAGEMVGEVALLEGAPRNATVYAIRDCDLAELPKDVFEALIEHHPQVMLETVRTILHRIRSPRARRATKEHLTITVVPSDPNFDLRMFTSKLVDDLKTIDDTTHLWSARVDSILGKERVAQSEAHDPGHLTISSWFQEIEHHSRFLVLETDRAMTAWTQRALRIADVVMVVVSANDDRAPSAIEVEVDACLADDSPPRRVLVILEEQGKERASNTDRWVQPRRVDDHYHLRRGSGEDFRRLTRILGGVSTGLVLSGGGARGFAHLGVIRALREHGVPIDIIGGSSIGSVMGVGPALDLDIGDMTELITRQFRNLLDYTVPVVSMIKGERIVRTMQETLGDLHIEDLWRPYFCMSTNLTRSIAIQHRRGPLVPALRASVAIPGVLPPVPHEGDLLVDGGVLNNLPVDEMRVINPSGTVIAVDVAPRDGPRAREDFGLSVSGTKQLLRKMAPGAAPQTPGIVRTFLRSMLVGALRERDRIQSEGSVDLYLDLDLRGVDLLAFESVPEVAARGYEAAAPRVEAWLETAGSLS